MKPIAIKKTHVSFHRKERGIVLMIALIVLVAMSLAGVALVRSVDTTTLIAGNLAFRQGTVQSGDRGLEAANNVLSTSIKGANMVDNLALNYYASRQPGETAKGIPSVLLKANSSSSIYPSTFAKITDPATKNDIRYVIERLCTGTGPAVAANCVMSSFSGKAADGGTTMETNLTPTGGPMYRVTVRVDGPHNTVSFIQAMLR